MWGIVRPLVGMQSVRQVACMAKERGIYVIYGRHRRATDMQPVRQVACMTKERDIYYIGDSVRQLVGSLCGR